MTVMYSVVLAGGYGASTTEYRGCPAGVVVYAVCQLEVIEASMLG